MEMPAEYQESWIACGYEWIEKMGRYLKGSTTARSMAINRINKPGSWDWDDNISDTWAADAKRQFHV